MAQQNVETRVRANARKPFQSNKQIGCPYGCGAVPFKAKRLNQHLLHCTKVPKVEKTDYKVQLTA